MVKRTNYLNGSRIIAKRTNYLNKLPECAQDHGEEDKLPT
jgi:hypothetical protein